MSVVGELVVKVWKGASNVNRGVVEYEGVFPVLEKVVSVISYAVVESRINNVLGRTVGGVMILVLCLIGVVVFLEEDNLGIVGEAVGAAGLVKDMAVRAVGLLNEVWGLAIVSVLIVVVAAV